MVHASADPLRDQRPKPKPRTRGHAVADTTTRADRARRPPPHKQATTHANATATRVNNRRQPPLLLTSHTLRARMPRASARRGVQHGKPHKQQRRSRCTTPLAMPMT